jgi:hypothetical protein
VTKPSRHPLKGMAPPTGRCYRRDVAGALECTLAALEEAQVRYLVVGGVAVVLHGHLRVTADLDLVVQLTPDNVERAWRHWSGWASGHGRRLGPASSPCPRFAKSGSATRV